MHDEIEVPQDLVEKMAHAMQEHWQSCSPAFQQLPGTDDRVWAQVAPTALRVALEDERVLGEPLKEEVDEVVRDGLGFGKDGLVNPDFLYGARLVLANRRARLLKPKTPEERVTIKRMENTQGPTFYVYVGENCVMNFSQPEHAEIYRLGLIAKLKAEQEE